MDIFWSVLGILSLIAAVLCFVLLPWPGTIPGVMFLYAGFRYFDIAMEMYQ